MTKCSLSAFARILACCALIVLCLGLCNSAVAAGPVGQSTPNTVARGPKIWLQESQSLTVTHVGPAAAGITGGSAQPLSMVASDIDRDGVEDLLVGYSTPTGGVVVLHRGNLDAFAPQSEASFQAIANSQFPSPFLPEAQVFAVPVTPDFMAVGDFTGHGLVDLAVAARGGSAIYILEGDGKGKFVAGETINLPGGVTALAADRFGKIQSALLVGASSGRQSFLAVYGLGGTGLTPLAALPLRASASNILFGEFGDLGPDAALLSGGQVFILRSSNMQLVKIGLPVSASAFTLGSFLFDRNGGSQIAVLGVDGSIQIAVRNEFDPRVYTDDEFRVIRQARLRGETPPLVPAATFAGNGWRIAEGFASLGSVTPGQAPVFFRTRISVNGADDILWLSAAGGQMVLISHPDQQHGAATFLPGTVSVKPYKGSPFHGLPMRTNVDGRFGVVALHQGETAPAISAPIPDPVFTVNRFDDPTPASPITNACNGVANDCSLREAILRANGDTVMLPAGTYNLTIGRVTATPDYTGIRGALYVNNNATIVGAGQNTTIIQWGTLTSGNTVDMVMAVNEDISPITNATASISNLTIQNGVNHGTHGNDGDGGCMEFDTGGNGNATLTLTNVTLQNCQTLQGSGGGLANFNFFALGIVAGGGTFPTGHAIINNSIIQGNSVTDPGPNTAGGGGIWVSDPSWMIMTNSQVLNNLATQTSGGGSGPGGGILIDSKGTANASPQTQIHSSTISGNESSIQGGGINSDANLLIDFGTIISGNKNGQGTPSLGAENGGGLFVNPSVGNSATLTKVTITGNTSTGTGGGIATGAVGAGGVTINFSRFAANTATNSGSNLENLGSTVAATNNWWGTNAAASTIHTTTGTTTFDPFIVLTHTASPNKIRINQTTTLTADMSKDNHGSGAALSGNLDEIIGLPITFNNAVDGTISNPQSAIQTNGTATATFNAGGVAGGGKADAVVDQATVTASIIVLQPPSITKSFSPTHIKVGGTSTITFAITNPNVATIDSSFTDDLTSGATVSGLVVAATPNVVNGCGGSVTANAGANSISFANPALPVSGSPCTITVDVTGTSDGLKPNSVTIDSADAGDGNTASATPSLKVINPPTINKVFGAATIPLNGTTSLTFTITNPNSDPVSALNGISFTDTLPNAAPGTLVVATPNGLTNTCSTTPTATAGSGAITLTGASLAVGASCTISVNVLGTVAGLAPNSVTASDTTAGAGAASNASLTVVGPPIIIKAFGAATIPLNGSTSLSFTLNNPNTTQGLSGVAFTDTLPAGLIISTPNGQTGSCGSGTITATQATNFISLSGGTLSASGSCNFSVNVTGTAAGAQNNTTGAVTSTEGGTGGTASASVTVVAPPTIAKAFNPTSIAVNANSQLTFTIGNPGNNTVALTGVGFTDTLPTGLVVATPNGLTNSCGGTASATAGGTSIGLTGGSIAVAGTCTVVVNITGAAAGVYTNTSGAVTSTNGGTGNTATANLTVASPPTIIKAFGAPTVPLGGSTSLTFTITNPNTIGLTGLAFSDTLPAGLVVATPPGTTNSCTGGTVTAVAGSGSISLSGGTVGASPATCTVVVSVTGTTAGVKNNTSGAVSATEGGTGNTASASITVIAPPVDLKQFNPSTNVAVGGTSTMTITIQNPNGTPLTVSFTDNFPAGINVGGTPGLANSCGGIATANANDTSVSLAGGSVAAGGSCTFVVTVAGISVGDWTNSVTVTSAEGGAGNAASAVLQVGPQPTFTKAFSSGGNPASSVPLNGTATLTFTIVNPVGTGTTLTNLGFTDNLPAGLQVAAIPNVGGTCQTAGGDVSVAGTVTANANATSISLSGLSLIVTATPPNGCTISVDVTGITPGTQNNSVQISSTEGGNGPTATATIDVVAPPSLAKAFNPTTIPLNGTTTLTFTIANPAGNTVSENGVGFSDTLPTGLTVPNASASVCGGTLTLTAPTGITLSGASVPVNSQCQFGVTVTGATAGQYTNTSGDVSSTNGGIGNAASANLTVDAPPTITKAFGALTIPQNGTTSLTFNINNPNTSGLTGVGFSDSLPAGLVVATPSGVTNSCSGGSVSASSGSGSVGLSGASLAASGSCTVSVNVQGTTAGLKINSVQASSNEGGTSGAANATILVVAPPVIIKAFGAATIALNGATSLTFTINNPNSSQSLSGIAFSDTLPAGLVVSTPNGLSGNTCSATPTAAAGGSTISLSGATLAALGSCSFSVNVTGAAAGAQTNTTGQVTSTEGGTGGTATAFVTVVAPPSIAKVFTPNTIALNATTSLTFTITNPAANTTVALAGVSFTDVLPTGLTVASSTSTVCGGTFTSTNSSGVIALSGASVAIGGQCQFSVTVTGAASGAHVNTTGNVTSTNGGTGNTASASLLVGTPQTVSKSFGATQIPVNGVTSLTFNIGNPNASTTLTGLSFTDNLPAGLVVANPNGLTNNCGGTATANVASGQVSLAGGTLAPTASCALSVNVQGTTPGIKINTVSVTSNEGGTSTANATITVVGPPALNKSFGAASVALGASTSLSFGVNNPNSTVGLSGIGFTDTLPAGLVVATPNGFTGSCGGGTITATQGTSVISLSGASLAAGGSCAFSMNVTGIAAGTEVNTTSAITSNEGGSGPVATASIAVVAPPFIAKFFTPGGIQPNGISTLTITVTNRPANTVAAAGVAFTDSLPSLGVNANLTIATPNGLTNTCGGTASANAGSTTVSLAGGSVGVNSSCSVTVNVTSSATGSYVNNTGPVSSTNGGTGGTASATLSVANPPTISKLFLPDTTGQNQPVTLSFTIQNPNSNSTPPNNDMTLTGIAFTDALPAGLVVANPTNISNDCGGTLTAIPGSGFITLSGGTIAPAVGLTPRPIRTSAKRGGPQPVATGACFISVEVLPTASGTLNNTTGPISANESGTGATSNTASLTVTPGPVVVAPTVAKAFGAAQVGVGLTTQLTFAVNNTNASTPLVNINFNDALPSGLVVASPNGLTGTCVTADGASVIANPGSGSVSLASVNLAAATSCSFSVNVTATSRGTKVNTTGNIVASFDTGGGNFQIITGGTATATINVVNPVLAITKTHTGNFNRGQTGATYTITVSNVGGDPTVGVVAVTDTLPNVNNTLVATNIAGTGWSCALATLTCTRADALNAGASYPPITLAVNVPQNIRANVVNTVTVSGGGDQNSHTASDSTHIGSPVQLTPEGSTITQVVAGGITSVIIDVDSSAGEGSLTLSCSGLPAGAACSFNPPNTTALTTAVTVTIGTTLGASARPPASGPGWGVYAMLFPVFGVVLLGAGAKRDRKRLRQLAVVLGIGLLASLLVLSGCGGLERIGGTPAAVSTVTVTATSTTTGDSGSTTINLTVLNPAPTAH